MAPKRVQSRRNDAPLSASSASSSSSGKSLTFSHFADIKPTPDVKPEPETKPDTEFKVSFQFVGNQDARKATTENRSHVMREYRRKQRWEQDQKKKQEKEKEKEKSDPRATKGASDGSVKTEEPDLASTLKLLSAAKRKRSAEESEYEQVLWDGFDQETNNMTMQLLSQVSHPTAYTPAAGEAPIMDVFTQRFVDNFAPESKNMGSANCIRTIANIRMFSPLLSNALNAVATTYAGQQVNDQQIVVAGQGIYTRVLKELQEALAHPHFSRSEAVLSTVVLCIAYESMRHTTPEALSKHCNGALQLIEYRGPYAHIHGLEHQCFSELRPYWAFAAIVFRTPTFLQEERWKSIPWATEPKDIMQHLLDHVCDVPSVLFQFDTIKKAPAENSLPKKEILELNKVLWQDMSGLHGRMLEWKLQHADTYPTGQPSPTTVPLGKDSFPAFRTRNPPTGETIAPPPLIYPDPQLCRTLCTFYGSMIVLGSIDSRPQDGSYGRPIAPLEIFGFAILICRSVEYFLRNVPGNMTNRMFFPLRAAWETFPRDGPEREFITAVFAQIEERRASTVWSKVTHKDE